VKVTGSQRLLDIVRLALQQRLVSLGMVCFNKVTDEVLTIDITLTEVEEDKHRWVDMQFSAEMPNGQVLASGMLLKCDAKHQAEMAKTIHNYVLECLMEVPVVQIKELKPVVQKVIADSHI
jgi:hypothetical protein